MEGLTLSSLAQCLDRLKRQVQWWKAVAAFVTLALAMFTAEARSQTVTVTIGELVGAPERYSGKEVAFDGILVERSYLHTVEKPGPSARPGRRVQLSIADMTGAQILVVTYVPSYDVPTLEFLGRTGTAYSVRGVFYHIPIEPGPPLHLVVVPGKHGLKKK